MSDNGHNAVKEKRRESDLYKPILEFLNFRPYTFAWRSGNHAVFDFRRQVYRKRAEHEKGMPDILGVKMKPQGGVPFCFEVKLEGEKATDHQIEWMRKFTTCGGIAYIVNNLEDVVTAWSEI